MEVFVRANGGELFRVEAICKTDAEANDVMKGNPRLAVIATDSNGLNYVAEIHPSGFIAEA